MRIVFMGSPEYAAIILEKLAQAFEVVAVYTNPDKVRSRGIALEPTPVKSLALKLGIPVETPRTLRDADVQAKLSASAPDAICVAAYGKILPQEVLDIPPLGCINVHASLLPRWRGAAPIQRAILAGDELQGVSIMRMEAGLDTGDYARQVSCPAAGKHAEDLTRELATMGADALVDVLHGVQVGTQEWTRQEESLVTYADKIAKGELNLSPDDACSLSLAKVLAADDAHPAKCRMGNRTLAVLDAAGSSEDVPAGTARLAAGKLLLGCADGALLVLKVKPDGKASMDAKAFAAGVQGVKQAVQWGALDCGDGR